MRRIKSEEPGRLSFNKVPGGTFDNGPPLRGVAGQDVCSVGTPERNNDADQRGFQLSPRERTFAHSAVSDKSLGTH